MRWHSGRTAIFLISRTLLPSSVTTHSAFTPFSSKTYIVPFSRYRSIISSCSSARKSRLMYLFLLSSILLIFINCHPHILYIPTGSHTARFLHETDCRQPPLHSPFCDRMPGFQRLNGLRCTTFLLHVPLPILSLLETVQCQPLFLAYPLTHGYLRGQGICDFPQRVSVQLTRNLSTPLRRKQHIPIHLLLLCFSGRKPGIYNPLRSNRQ